MLECIVQAGVHVSVASQTDKPPCIFVVGVALPCLFCSIQTAGLVDSYTARPALAGTFALSLDTFCAYPCLAVVL